nr:proline reductase-associated electron transfer protein PrdC [Spiroplasma alleghenense]
MNTALKLLLKQHVGPPCKPIVKINEQVKRGQLIAVPDGIGVNIHASFSGKIVEITSDYIGIEDFDLNEPLDNFVKLDKNLNHLQLIEAAGVVGAGGAGFPAFIKYAHPFENNDGTVIINAAECEPSLQHNIYQIENDFDTVLRGLKYMMEVTNAKKGVVATKHKYKKAFLTIRKALEKEPNIELFDLSDMYPAGDERVIIREVCGIQLAPGELPFKAKAIVSNVETFKNITRAIEDLRPVFTKDLTVGGKVNLNSSGKVFMDVPLGITAREMLEKVNGVIEPIGPLYVGGPFMGQIKDIDTPITKTTGGFLVAMPLLDLKEEKFGLIGCECGAQLPELRDLAQLMKAEVVGELNCKRMEPDENGRLRCNLPGICPGQAPTVLKLKKMGATTILIGTCESRTNTVARVTPNMGLKLIHKSDFTLRATGHSLYRRIDKA